MRPDPFGDAGRRVPEVGFRAHVFIYCRFLNAAVWYDLIMDFNYRMIWPDRCCGNCAYGSYLENNSDNAPLIMNRCAWMDFVFSQGYDDKLSLKMLDEPVFDRCGLCDKWLPRQLALCAKDSSSFDEFRLKRLAYGFDDFRTDELDDWFAERKATGAQLRAVSFLLRRPGKIPPAMVNPAEIDEEGRIFEIKRSNSFYSVQNWLSKNMRNGWETDDEPDSLAEMMI